MAFGSHRRMKVLDDFMQIRIKGVLGRIYRLQRIVLASSAAPVSFATIGRSATEKKTRRRFPNFRPSTVPLLERAVNGKADYGKIRDYAKKALEITQ